MPLPPRGEAAAAALEGDGGPSKRLVLVLRMATSTATVMNPKVTTAKRLLVQVICTAVRKLGELRCSLEATTVSIEWGTHARPRGLALEQLSSDSSGAYFYADTSQRVDGRLLSGTVVGPGLTH